MRKFLLTICLLLLPSSLFAERAVLIQLPNGKLIGVAYTSSGNIVLTDIEVIKLPGPAPNPTPIPVPTKVVRAMIVYETENSTQEMAALIDQIRDDAQLSRKIPDILDQHTKDENRNPDTEVQEALKFFKGETLPRLVGFDSQNKPVIQESLLDAQGKLKSLNQIKNITQSWGM